MIKTTSTTPDWGTLFQPVTDGATGAATAALPLGIPVLVILVGIGIVLLVLRKFGVKR